MIFSFEAGASDGIKLWELEINELLETLKSNYSESTLTFKKRAYAERYPRLQWNAKLIGVTDTVWYLMQENQRKVEMWRLELDSLMWTLYDPDQVPGINHALIELHKVCNRTATFKRVPFSFTSWFQAAYSVTKTNDVAFFGSGLGFYLNGTEDL